MTRSYHTHFGGCHCKAVRFEVALPEAVDVETCNCSICAMSGNDHIIVPAERFKLLSGNEALSEYRFNTGKAKHLFCKICGVKAFYVPRSNPDAFAVTYRCIDDWQSLKAAVHSFDGIHWEKSIAALHDRQDF